MDQAPCARGQYENAPAAQAEDGARAPAARADFRGTRKSFAGSNRSPIVEQIQSPMPRKAELNSHFWNRRGLRYGKLRLSGPPTDKTASPPRKRGAPFGNRNALKHGKYVGELRDLRAAIRAHISKGQVLLGEIAPLLAVRGGTRSRVQHRL
jgi:hypothetical protein